jgi:hypothetical protein
VVVNSILPHSSSTRTGHDFPSKKTAKEHRFGFLRDHASPDHLLRVEGEGEAEKEAAADQEEHTHTGRRGRRRRGRRRKREEEEDNLKSYTRKLFAAGR